MCRSGFNYTLLSSCVNHQTSHSHMELCRVAMARVSINRLGLGGRVHMQVGKHRTREGCHGNKATCASLSLMEQQTHTQVSSQGAQVGGRRQAGGSNKTAYYPPTPTHVPLLINNKAYSTTFAVFSTDSQPYTCTCTLRQESSHEAQHILPLKTPPFVI